LSDNLQAKLSPRIVAFGARVGFVVSRAKMLLDEKHITNTLKKRDERSFVKFIKLLQIMNR